MKKVCNRLLALLLIGCLVLAGCATETPVEVTTTPTTEPVVTTNPYSLESSGPFISNISAGFGRVDISPTEPTALHSSGSMSSDIQDPLYATCIALTDSSDNTVLLFTLDLINSYSAIMDDARQLISDETEIPFDAILVSATQSSSSPDLTNPDEPSVANYIAQLKSWMVEAAVAALADRAPAKVYITSTATENLNFVNRYHLQNGNYAGDNFGNFKDAPIAAHETAADNCLQLICLNRQYKQDILLANYQVDPNRDNSTNVTADLIAPFREKMEATTGCQFAYFTGASGNVDPSSRIEEENVTLNYIEQGQALADYALSAYATFQEVPTTSVKISKTLYAAKVDHSLDGWKYYAQEAVNYYNAHGEFAHYFQTMQNGGITSEYLIHTLLTRSQMPKQVEIPIYAVSLGDVAFVTVPFDMFDTNGMQIKNGSPYSMTFVLTGANNSYGYLPSEVAFKHGGYSVDVTLFARGTAEDLVSSYLDMLKTLYYGK